MAIGPQAAPALAGFQIKAEHTISAEQITNLMISFVEGGDPVTRSWCCGIKPRPEDVTVVTQGPWYADPKFWAQEGFQITVLEDEDETGEPEKCKRHLIDRAKIIKGFELLAAGHDGAFARRFTDIINFNDDAATADIFMQMVVFGEEVYG